MQYLEVEHVLVLHAEVMARLGSRPEPLLKDGRPRLEAALARPRHAAFYAEADLCLQAALLVTGVAQAHAFTDGNKRTATVAMVVFLGLNGLRLRRASSWISRTDSSKCSRSNAPRRSFNISWHGLVPCASQCAESGLASNLRALPHTW